MYWFGEITNKNLSDPSEWRELDELARLAAQANLEDILSTLNDFSFEWREGSASFKEAFFLLKEEGFFSEDEIIKSLKIIPELFQKNNLIQRLEAEIGFNYLTSFSKIKASQAKMKAYPVGIVSHITAGNIFLSAIDSLIMGLITKNLNIVKLSHRNESFPLFFAKKLRAFDTARIVANKFSLLSWKGGDQVIESIIKEKSDVILAWGGEEMIASYRQHLPLKTKLVELGPKFSFQVLTHKGLEHKSLSKIAQHIVNDIIPWNQRACSAPQNLFIEETYPLEELLAAIKEAFEAAPTRDGVSDDEYVELHKEIYRGLYSSLMGEGALLAGEDYIVHLESDEFARPSALNRTLIIKRFKDLTDLSLKLRPLRFYLQTCSYLVDEGEATKLFDLLAWSGVKRFSPLGKSASGLNGTPHDGEFILRRLTNFVTNEVQSVDYGEAYQRNDSSLLKKEFEKTLHPSGYIFSSGGTTGEPKYVHFSNEEFSYVSDMLAFNLSKQGVGVGDVVANLFVAGNMWSSFLAVDRALEKIGTASLPIGGLCSVENIISYLVKFKPQVIMGIPSLLILVAEKMKELNLSITINSLFYGGERLSQSRIALFQEVWGISYFGSAGYASVDAGVIGYQCPHSRPGEHHLFSSLVDLKVINGEAVVTPIYRDTLNLKHYHTGDEVELLAECPCGAKDQKFLLKGRMDDLIQIWSARIRLAEIENVLSRYDITSYKVQAREVSGKEVLLLEVESDEVFPHLMSELYSMNQDLPDSLDRESFFKLCSIEWKGRGEVARNSRTGKISLFEDLRS